MSFEHLTTKDITKLIPVCGTCKFWRLYDAKNTRDGQCLRKGELTHSKQHITTFNVTCEHHDYIESKLLAASNRPIQIQHTIMTPPTAYDQPIELLTVLYQDGTIMQGRCLEGYRKHTWRKIDVKLPKSEEK